MEDDGDIVDERGVAKPVKNPVTFEEMYKSVKRYQGMTDEAEIEERWQKYLEENPRLKRDIETQRDLVSRILSGTAT